MSNETIHIIEDEKNIVELIKHTLEREGYKTAASFRGDTGLEEVKKKRPDLVILDLMLPELNGLEVCKILKQNEKTAHIPIIMLTAKGEDADQILGLELGADDYVTKPFSPRQLAARVKAGLRRLHYTPKNKTFRIGKLEMDTGKHTVTVHGKSAELSSKEYGLLQALLEANGRVLSREFLLEHVWGYDRSIEVETRTIDMHVGQLRKKLKSEAGRLITVKNAGYRFDNEP